MKNTIWLTLFALVLSSGAFARTVALGSFDVVDGTPTLNGTPLDLPLGSNGKKPVTKEEDLILLNHDYFDKYALLSYWDRNPGAVQRTTAFVIIDFAGGKPIISNSINTLMDINWGDNNFIFVKNGALYFGIYFPKPMQFYYKNGVLSENTGPWAGPNKPEKYIVPDEKDQGPCFNVANVPECIAEQERDEAKKHSKSRRRKSGSPSVH